jgi:hypothetical protein
VIYGTGGTDYGGVLNTVYSANIQSDGSLSPWVAQTPIPYALESQSSVANGMLYIIGGGNFGSVWDRVYYSHVNSEGNLGQWQEAVGLPQAVSNLGGVAASGRIFTMAGFLGTGVTDDFYMASVAGDGSLGAWSVGTPLPQALFEHAAAVGNSYIFVSGGNNYNDTVAQVISMPLPPQPTTPRLTGTKTNQNFSLQLTSSTNTGFGIQASTNLTTWTNIGWGFTSTNGSLIFQDTNAGSFSKRFYRACWPLP